MSTNVLLSISDRDEFDIRLWVGEVVSVVGIFSARDQVPTDPTQHLLTRTFTRPQGHRPDPLGHRELLRHY